MYVTRKGEFPHPLGEKKRRRGPLEAEGRVSKARAVRILHPTLSTLRMDGRIATTPKKMAAPSLLVTLSLAWAAF